MASPAMCRAWTHSSWVSPLSPAPSARLAVCTRRTAAPVSSLVRAAATRGTGGGGGGGGAAAGTVGGVGGYPAPGGASPGGTDDQPLPAYPCCGCCCAAHC